MGRLNSVTKGRFQEVEFNDSFPAMNPKSGQSLDDTLLPVAFTF
jgi:hypothetical protein